MGFPASGPRRARAVAACARRPARRSRGALLLGRRRARARRRRACPPERSLPPTMASGRAQVASPRRARAALRTDLSRPRWGGNSASSGVGTRSSKPVMSSASETRNDPTRVRLSSAKCAPVPKRWPRSCARERIYVPLETDASMRARGPSSSSSSMAWNSTSTGGGVTAIPRRARRCSRVPLIFFAE